MEQVTLVLYPALECDSEDIVIKTVESLEEAKCLILKSYDALMYLGPADTGKNYLDKQDALDYIEKMTTQAAA